MWAEPLFGLQQDWTSGGEATRLADKKVSAHGQVGGLDGAHRALSICKFGDTANQRTTPKK